MLYIHNCKTIFNPIKDKFMYSCYCFYIDFHFYILWASNTFIRCFAYVVLRCCLLERLLMHFYNSSSKTKNVSVVFCKATHGFCDCSWNVLKVIAFRVVKISSKGPVFEWNNASKCLFAWKKNATRLNTFVQFHLKLVSHISILFHYIENLYT